MIETMKGTVMRSGFAKSESERDTAEAIARNVKSVVAGLQRDCCASLTHCAGAEHKLPAPESRASGLQRNGRQEVAGAAWVAPVWAAGLPVRWCTSRSSRSSSFFTTL